MAINPYFPSPYQQPMNPYQVQMMQNQLAAMQQMQPVNQQNILAAWVQGGEQSMKSFPLGANQKAFLFSTEENIFGMKSTDASGMPLPLEMFRYEKINADKTQNSTTTAAIDTSAFITREEFESRIAKIYNYDERTKIKEKEREDGK